MTGQTEGRLRSLAADLDSAAPAVGVAEATRRRPPKPVGFPRRPGRLPLVAAAAAVLAVAAIAALTSSDTESVRTGPAPATDSGTRTQETSTTTGPAPAPAEVPTGPVTARIPVAVAGLPEVGVGMVEDDEVVLFDGAGAELGRSPRGDFLVITPGEPLGVTVADAVAVIVSGPAAPRPAGSPFADDCMDANRAGGVVIARCGSPHAPERIDVAFGRAGVRTLVRSPPADPGAAVVGHWSSARLAPDGSRVLAQWSAECEAPFAFLIGTSTGEPIAVTGERGTEWMKAPSSSAAGWLPDGRAVVSLRSGPCGSSVADPGVYVSAGPGSSDLRMLSRSADGAPAVFVWERRDDPRWEGPQLSGSGTPDTKAFNRFLAERRPPWAAQAETAAAVALAPIPEGEGTTRSVKSAREAGRPGRVVVTVIDDRLPDDSVRAQRYRLTFVAEPGGPLRLEGVLVDWRCWEGRGHQDYSTELCV